jgi:hypothetical protein
VIVVVVDVLEYFGAFASGTPIAQFEIGRCRVIEVETRIKGHAPGIGILELIDVRTVLQGTQVGASSLLVAEYVIGARGQKELAPGLCIATANLANETAIRELGINVGIGPMAGGLGLRIGEADAALNEWPIEVAPFV